MEGLFPFAFGFGGVGLAVYSICSTPSSTPCLLAAIGLGVPSAVVLLWTFLGEPKWGE
ncbi:MAG TPA: hypothetical protein VMR46_02060 [Candidatus Paceibacterota bacterium]|nr:hypothetical protein [Candidatus Paceibacterota bacterium]